MTPSSSPLLSLDEILEAFEAAQTREGQVDPAAFLPSSQHPQYLDVLRELVRVDLEYGWRRGKPTRLETYRRRFPDLFLDPESLRAIAYEEYRQRGQAGERPAPAEYASAYGVDTTGWPSAAKGPPPPAPEHTHLVSNDGDLAAAARAYLEFSVGHSSATSGEVKAWAESVQAGAEYAPLFRDVHQSNPQAARRLAQAVTALPPVGTMFLGFRLLAILGTGTFGRVYLAQQGDLADRLVALKVSAEVLGESRRLAQLQHTNIVPVYSVHRSRPFQAVCMPYFGSTTLADVFRNLHDRESLPASGRHLIHTLQAGRSETVKLGSSAPPGSSGRGSNLGGRGGIAATALETVAVGARPLTASLGYSTVTLKMLEGLTYVQAILWLGARLADGLAHAHERGILHRDLKPANILLTDEGQPMLLDFNLSEDTKQRDGVSAALIGGTLPFMAPEQLDALGGGPGEVDARSDLYALGVILFELLTGRHPFPLRRETVLRVLEPMRADRRGPPPALRPHNRAVSPAVEAIVRRCLQPEPGDRYQSARELQEDLQRQLDHLLLKHTPEPSPRERLGKWFKRHPRLASTGSLLLVALVLLLGMGGAYVVQSFYHARLEARDTLEQFEEDYRSAQVLIAGTRSADQEQLDEGMARCRKALERFGVLQTPHWRARAAFRNLDPADQARVQDELGETLLLLAAATQLHASNHPERSGREEQARTALRWNQLAETCFVEGSVPGVLWQQRAVLLKLLGGPEDEIERLEAHVEAAPPRTARHLYALGSQLNLRGKFSEALPLLLEAARLDPQNFHIWFALGVCRDALLHNPEAAACYTTCIALWPESHHPYLRRGQVYLRQRQYREADLDFTAVLERLPDRAEVYIHRAFARNGLGDSAGAIASLTTALERGGPAGRIHLMRARIRELAGDKAGAETDRAAGLKCEPTDAQTWLDRGSTRLTADPLAALADFQKAVELNPRSLEGLLNQASILAERLGRTAEAIEVLNRLIALYPDYVPARASRGVLLARLNKRSEAVADAEACLLRDMKPETVYQVAGIYALTSRQQPDDATQAFQLLSSALHRGYGQQFLLIDPDLEPIKERAEFRALVAKHLQGRPPKPNP